MSNYKPYMNVATGLWSFDKGVGMVELNLVDALVAKLQEVFKDYELTAKSGRLQTVKVFAQYLPQPSEPEVTVNDESELESQITPQGYSAEDIESLFPCVVVKYFSCTDKEEGKIDQCRVEINFLIWTYDESPDCQGYRDVLNIMEVIREELLSMPSRILDNRYRLEMPFKNYLFDEQAFPVYFGVIESVWETGRPIMPNFVR